MEEKRDDRCDDRKTSSCDADGIEDEGGIHGYVQSTDAVLNSIWPVDVFERNVIFPNMELLLEVLGDVEVVHGSLVAAAGNVLLRALLGSIWGVGSFAQVHQMQAIPLVNAELGCQFVRDISQCFVQFLLDLIADLICGILEVSFQPGPDRCGSG